MTRDKMSRDPRAFISFEVTAADYALFARAARLAGVELEEWARARLLSAAEHELGLTPGRRDDALGRRPAR